MEHEDTVTLTRHKLDIDDFDRMVETGILGRHDRVELIDGELIEMAPIGQGHEGFVNYLNETLVLACHGRAIVSAQNSLRLDRYNVPEPDFAVFRRRADYYDTGERPGPADTLLVVEVADTSLRYDRTVKLRLYAGASIPEYWIVDINRRLLQAYRLNSEDGYGEPTTHGVGESLTLSALPDITITLALLFGERPSP